MLDRRACNFGDERVAFIFPAPRLRLNPEPSLPPCRSEDERLAAEAAEEARLAAEEAAKKEAAEKKKEALKAKREQLKKEGKLLTGKVAGVPGFRRIGYGG